MSWIAGGGTAGWSGSFIGNPAGGGGGPIFVVRQDMVFSLPFPFYLNEVSSQQEAVMSTLVNET